MVYLNCLSDLRSGFTVIPIGRLQVALSFLFFFIIFTLSTVDIHNSRPLDAFRIFFVHVPKDDLAVYVTQSARNHIYSYNHSHSLGVSEANAG